MAIRVYVALPLSYPGMKPGAGLEPATYRAKVVLFALLFVLRLNFILHLPFFFRDTNLRPHCATFLHSKNYFLFF